MTPAPTILTADRIQRSMMRRFAPLPDLSMETLAQQLNNFRTGYLSPAARTWEIMVERDSELGGVLAKRCADSARLPWEIIAEDETDRESAAHAEALRYAYGRLRTTAALDQDLTGGVRTLIHQILTSHAHRYSVHEMRLRIDDAARREVTLELTHCPVWWFEARRGRLAFLPDDGAWDGLPLEDGRWLRAVGHGYMRSLCVAYLCKWMPMSAWILYTHRFGLPGVHGKTDAKPDSAEWTNFTSAVEQFANDWVAVTNREADISLIQAAGSADAPFAPLIEYVDRAYAKLLRGGDLSTGSRDNQAVGSSNQATESDAILHDDAAFVTDLLNEQVDRPLIRYLFGVEPKAWFRLNPPKRTTLYPDIAAATFLTSRGFRISNAEAGERFGFREALMDEPALAVGIPGGDAVPGGPPLPNSADDLVTRAIDAIARASAGDMAPLRERMERLLELDNPEAQRQGLMNLLDEIPEFAREVLRNPSAAEPIGHMLGTAYVTGLAQSRPNRT